VSRPSQEAIQLALAQARSMLGGGPAANATGRYLLYLERRNRELEPIVELLDHYLNFGEPETEHARLVKMLQRLHEEERHEQVDPAGEFGLE